ncbi:MAG: hypothetical protein CMJ35_03805 [Phycisphaerae bacterium]|nr:hypothetical protein [Phycisphaerae bacterium]
MSAVSRAADEAEPACRAIEVRIEPTWDQWADALSKHMSDSARDELGIPNDRPVLFSGHQPVIFHNGILAKLIAQHEAAKRTGAHRVWIIADQDHVELEHLRVPTGHAGSLSSRTIQVLASDSIPAGVPSASLPAMPTEAVDDDRLEAIVEYLLGYTHESTLARQFANATIGLACERLDIEPPQIIYASALFTSDTLWAIVQRMLDDPRACVERYNEAVGGHPQARVRPLMIEDGRVELPMWGLRDGRARVAIDTDNIDTFQRHELAPRGLFMSLLVRAHLGELFIHGTGGWAYDRITQDWAKAWLGMELSPMALATATQHLELGWDPDEAVGVNEASWRLHHARHTPGMLGDESAQRQKDELVSDIEQAKASGTNPDAPYQQLQSLLERYRGEHRQQLDALRDRVDQARAMQKQIALANDRTWPFVLFSEQQLGDLRRAVVGAMH